MSSFIDIDAAQLRALEWAKRMRDEIWVPFLHSPPAYAPHLEHAEILPQWFEHVAAEVLHVLLGDHAPTWEVRLMALEEAYTNTLKTKSFAAWCAQHPDVVEKLAFHQKRSALKHQIKMLENLLYSQRLIVGVSQEPPQQDKTKKQQEETESQILLCTKEWGNTANQIPENIVDSAVLFVIVQQTTALWLHHAQKLIALNSVGATSLVVQTQHEQGFVACAEEPSKAPKTSLSLRVVKKTPF